MPKKTTKTSIVFSKYISQNDIEAKHSKPKSNSKFILERSMKNKIFDVIPFPSLLGENRDITPIAWIQTIMDRMGIVVDKFFLDRA
jgi:hypothetical protein